MVRLKPQVIQMHILLPFLKPWVFSFVQMTYDYIKGGLRLWRHCVCKKRQERVITTATYRYDSKITLQPRATATKLGFEQISSSVGLGSPTMTITGKVEIQHSVHFVSFLYVVHLLRTFGLRIESYHNCTYVLLKEEL